MQVNRVATAHVITARSDDPITEIAESMRREKVGFIPVIEPGHHPLGVLTDRDIAVRVVAARKDPDQVLAKDVMTRPAHFIYEDAELKQAAKLMADRGIRRLLVLDHEDRVVGVLSLDDLALFTDGDETTGRVLSRIAEEAFTTAAFAAVEGTMDD